MLNKLSLALHVKTDRWNRRNRWANGKTDTETGRQGGRMKGRKTGSLGAAGLVLTHLVRASVRIVSLVRTEAELSVVSKVRIIVISLH